MPIENVLIALLNVSLKEMMGKNIAFLHFFELKNFGGRKLLLRSEIQRNIENGQAGDHSRHWLYIHSKLNDSRA